MSKSANLLTIFWNNMPKILKFILLYTVALTLLLVFMRLLFYVLFNTADSPLSSADFWTSMWLGFRFDLRVAVATVLPLFFIGWVKWFNPFHFKSLRIIWHGALILAFTLISLSYIVDIGHYAYLNSRLNFTAMRFLEDAAISASMVWESYPVIWITLGWFLSITVFIFSLEKIHNHVAEGKPKKLKIWQGVIVGFASFLIVFIAAYSKFSQYPLRWSEATFSKHPFAAQLTYNPVHYFFDTWKNGRINYNLEDTRDSYNVIADFLGVQDKNSGALNYQRHFSAKKGVGDQPNIVLIIVESYASYKTTLSGNPLNPTPHTQALAESGYFFKNFFTPSTGTARSIFTTITSMPDVELKGTSSRNPLIVDQHTIMDEFKGYEKYYFIGGSASWGNIRGILTKNIKGLKLYEEQHYSSPRNDVWGISDIDLFREANTVLKKEKKPFFAIIQTSGNHRPYTIPDESYGFELQHPGDDEARRYGFHNEGEFNAYRLMDHSIKHFSKLAKEAGYDKNTIFALWGDHGIDGFAGEHTYKGESSSKLALGSLRVPFVVWSPGLIKDPKELDTVVSEVDVLATMANLAGQEYTATTMGRDMLDSKYDDRRYAFTIYHTNPPRIGMLGDEYYFRMSADGSNAGLHSVYGENPLEDVSEEHPELAKKLRELTLAYYKTSQYMAYHNKEAAVKK
ncbi:MAG: sulfatase-like hydrolase/transferase [Campylobacterota bacterium]|nr:sulfatase-like hydrolase/transferase [Campylobacterota bacterium]